MSRTLTKTQAVKTLKITPERHRLLRRLAADRDLNMMEVTDRVIAAGVDVLRQDGGEPRQVSPN